MALSPSLCPHRHPAQPEPDPSARASVYCKRATWPGHGAGEGAGPLQPWSEPWAAGDSPRTLMDEPQLPPAGSPGAASSHVTHPGDRRGVRGMAARLFLRETCRPRSGWRGAEQRCLLLRGAARASRTATEHAAWDAVRAGDVCSRDFLCTCLPRGPGREAGMWDHLLDVSL